MSLSSLYLLYYVQTLDNTCREARIPTKPIDFQDQVSWDQIWSFFFSERFVFDYGFFMGVRIQTGVY